MKDNFNTTVTGTKVVLVPFRREHAGRYMAWMQDPYIREMTGSEDLELNTLQQAEELQASVFEDPNNLTFLIAEQKSESLIRLIGDVNIFLQESEENDSEIRGEVNIMIGEEEARRKGLAREALFLAFRYAIEQYKATSLLARISDSNVASINLFANKLKWPIESHSEAFSETSFKIDVTPEFQSLLASNAPIYIVSSNYDEIKEKVE